MRYKVSYIFNLIIFTLVLLSTIMMFIGFNFMGNSLTLSATKIETFKYFTVDSNILMGITSLIFACYEYLVMKNKRESIPINLYVIKLISTVCVMLTFLVTLFYLTPKFSNPLVLYKNSNLFFHLIIPLLSLITFIFFEKTNKIKFKYTLLSLIPIVLYGIFYITNILTHLDNGLVVGKYDFYGFASLGVNTIVYVLIFMLLVSYVISLIIWYLNKINIKKA